MEHFHEKAKNLDRLEETVWVIQAQAGDFAAFARLIKRYERPLFYYLRRLAPKGDGALDVFQEVWIEAFRGLPSLHVPEAFRVWLYRIAHNKAARFVRDDIRRKEIDNLSQPEQTTGPDETELNAEAIHHGLASLPASQREILTLHYLHELSIADLGRILNCPPGTVKSRLYHARLALRQIIERKNL